MSKTDMYLLAYFTVVSVIAVCVTMRDKKAAVVHRRRTPEAVLFAIAAVGGSAAMYFTMCLIRHKTSKNRFVLGIPMIFALQCLILYSVMPELFSLAHSIV